MSSSTVRGVFSREGDLSDRLGTPVAAVVAVSAFALLIRLVNLGARVAHQDEARVAYWAIRYLETGEWHYRPIVHGPFLTQINATIFGLIGASDFSSRLIVALVGGLLPLVALLFRERLRDSEVVALALLLALNPLLLYYSRFMRNDLLLAGFMLVAFALLVHAYDTRDSFYLYAGTAFFALAFTTKENALVYPVIWLGATVLLLDHRVFLSRAGEEGWKTVLGDSLRRTGRGLLNWALPIVLSVLEFFAIVVFFYAPRGTASRPNLWNVASNPLSVFAVIEFALVESWTQFTEQWGGGNEGSYLSAAQPLVDVIIAAALPLLLLAILGFVVDRYADRRPRDVVAFCAYWGFVSVLGYPIIVDNPFPWEPIHAIVPLAVPAAVGLALLYRTARDAVAGDDRITAGAAIVLLLLITGQVGATAVQTSYLQPQDPDNELVQYAQSSSEMKPTLAALERVIRENRGTDVLYYGDEFYSPDESAHDVAPAGPGWFDRLPLSWYFEIYDARVTSTKDPSQVASNPPPIVITLGAASTCSDDYQSAADIEDSLGGYERHEVQRYGYDSGCTVSSVVIFVDESRVG